MAFHPFRTFQKNKTGCMAAVTLLAIISFIFLGVVIQLLDGGRGGGGGQITTIAESRRFGKITEFELERLRNSQEGLRRFLFVLYRNLDRNLAFDRLGEEDRRRALGALGNYIEQVTQNQNAEGLINVWLVTQYVQEEGLTPGWEDVKNLLQELTGGYISDGVFDETSQAVGMSRNTIEQLFARQIQWDQAFRRFHLSISAVSPATRWDWFQRLYRQVTIEAVAVPTEAFIGQVAEPTERQLNAFFEQHKGNRHNPMLAENGFIMPTELAFQYIIAEPTQQLLDSITEEEMLAYYEENKEELFRRPVRPISELPQLPGMMPGSAFPFPTPGRPVTPIMPGLPDIGDLLPEPAQNETEQTEPPTAEETIEVAPEPRQEDVPSDEPVSTESVNSEKSVKSIEETSALSGVLTRLVSYQTDETPEPVADTDSHSQSDSQLEETEAVADQTPYGMVTPRIIIQEEEEEFVMPRADAPLTTESEPATEESEPIDLSILYFPFDEVKDRIRATLAQDKAMEALPVIQETMREFANIYHEHFEQNRPIPPMPDLTGIVAEQGLELVTVPLGNIFAARQTELARRGFQEEQHLVQMFRGMPLLFGSNVFWGSDGPVLYWVTEEKRELQPHSLNDVRDIVRQRWKEVEARTLAQKRAEELANEAKASGGSLSEVFAGRSDVAVVDTEPFTWMTYRGLHPIMAMQYRIPPELGEVRESGVVAGDANFGNRWIVSPGWDFMATVYSLQVGETGVVFNQPQTAAYIVRVTSSSPSADVLWEQFQTTNVRVYFPAGAQEMLETSFEAWLDEIRNKTGFRWINKPDSREWEEF